MASQESDLPRWRPFRARLEGVEAEDRYDALHEGITAWLKPSILGWVRDQLDTNYIEVTREGLLRLERELRLPLSWEKGPSPGHLVNRMAADDDLCLEVVDYLLRDLQGWDRVSEAAVLAMAKMLVEAGSAWEVVRRSEDVRGYTIERRLPEPVVASAREVFGAPRAGDHLQKAWHSAYGRSPNPSDAYLEAVKAVEAAARPVVIPKDPKATLGTMIRALEQAPMKWEVVLGAMPGPDQVDVVRLMANLLWKGQTDRHGSDDPAHSVSPTQEQAEAAVHLAVLLVQWFSSGSIRVRP